MSLDGCLWRQRYPRYCMQPLPGIRHCGTRDRLSLRLLTVAGWAEQRSQIAHSHPQTGLDVRSARPAPPLAWLFNLNQWTKLQDGLSQVNSVFLTPPVSDLVEWNWHRTKAKQSLWCCYQSRSPRSGFVVPNFKHNQQMDTGAFPEPSSCILTRNVSIFPPSSAQTIQSPVKV